VILSLVLCAVVEGASAQQPVIPVYEEPMHRLVLARLPVRVLDVQVPPGATSLYHLHNDPIFYVAIDISEIDAQVLGEEWKRTKVSAWSPGSVAHDVSYVEQPLIHRIRNSGSDDFRLIAVTNNGPPVPPAGPDGDAALPGELETGVEWFRQSRVTLSSATGGVWIRSPFPVVVVQVSPGRAELLDGSGVSQALTGPGSFAITEPDHAWELRDSGAQPVTLVVIEVR